MVGHLIYLSLTRPDIAYIVSVISQFMHAPIQDHLKVAYKVLRYVKSCPENDHHQVAVYIQIRIGLAH